MLHALFMGTTKFIRLETNGWTRLHSEKIFYHLKNNYDKEKRTKMKQKINIEKRRKFQCETTQRHTIREHM